MLQLFAYISSFHSNIQEFLVFLLTYPALALFTRINVLSSPEIPSPPMAAYKLGASGQHCQLLGSLALLIQGAMGLLALSSLVIKRYYESPRRPWEIWFFDVSKQVFGALGLHLINLGLSINISEPGSPKDTDNPCTWYLINLFLDTTLGVPILWCFLYMIHMTAFRIGITDIISGQYGTPPKWSAFAKQAGLYMLGLVCMKTVLCSIITALPWIKDFGEYLLSWATKNPELQIVFVMLVFPMIMNTVQYYIIDSIIQSPEYNFKKKSRKKMQDKDHSASKKNQHDFLGQLEADEELEQERMRKHNNCQFHSSERKWTNSSDSSTGKFADLDIGCSSVGSWDEDTWYYATDYDETTPILFTCTCRTKNPSRATTTTIVVAKPSPG